VASDNGADLWLNDQVILTDNDDHEYKYWNQVRIIDRLKFRVGENVLSGKKKKKDYFLYEF